MKIGIDMDGVIANSNKKLVDNANKRFFLDIKEEEIDHHGIENKVLEKLPDSYVKMRFQDKSEIRPLIFNNNFFLSLVPYEGAIEAVKKLSNLHHEIYFVTKVINWDDCPRDKNKWLEKMFPDIKWNLICVDSMKTKGLVGVDLIIDDDPRVIRAFPGTKFLMKRPWNKKFREVEKEHEYIEVSSMSEAVEQIQQMKRK